MNWWVFKWSARDKSKRPGLAHEWATSLKEHGEGGEFECFGRTDDSRGTELAGLEIGDRAFAYQSIEQAIYGIVDVVELDRKTGRARVRVRRILTHPRKLKWMRKVDPRIELIGAFEQGPVQSMRKLTQREAEVLLDHCEIAKEDLA